jgi:hypothetical protein
MTLYNPLTPPRHSSGTWNLANETAPTPLDHAGNGLTGSVNPSLIGFSPLHSAEDISHEFDCMQTPTDQIPQFSAQPETLFHGGGIPAGNAAFAENFSSHSPTLEFCRGYMHCYNKLSAIMASYGIPQALPVGPSVQFILNQQPPLVDNSNQPNSLEHSQSLCNNPWVGNGKRESQPCANGQVDNPVELAPDRTSSNVPTWSFDVDPESGYDDQRMNKELAPAPTAAVLQLGPTAIGPPLSRITWKSPNTSSQAHYQKSTEQGQMTIPKAKSRKASACGLCSERKTRASIAMASCQTVLTAVV